MQDVSKKGRRRSSIMIVEKTGEKDEVFKNPRNNQEGSKKNEGMSHSIYINSAIKEKVRENGEQMLPTLRNTDEGRKSPDDFEGEDSQKKESEGDEDPNKEPGLSGEDENSKEDDSKKEEKKDVSKEESVSEEDFLTAEEARSVNSEEGNRSRGISEEAKPTPPDEGRKVVGFNESKNTEHEVEKDSEKSIPLEVEERNVKGTLEKRKRLDNTGTLAPGECADSLINGCELEQERLQGNVIYEGSGFKRKWLCYCFWVKRYFVLMRDGSLRYYRDKNKPGSLFLKTSDIEMVSRKDNENERNRSQICMEAGGRKRHVAFVSADVRDAWIMKVSEVIRSNRESR